MSRPFRVTVTGSGVSVPYAADYGRNPFAIGVGVTVASTTAVAHVEHCFDPIFQNVFPSSIPVIPASAATWFPNTSISSVSSNADANYAFPVVGIRLRVSSTGIATLMLSQAGP
jgi:hypothetical protein